jgi:uncharacterized protein (TIGR02757 family)
MPALAASSSTSPAWARRRVSWRALGAALAGFDARFPRRARLQGDPLHLAHGWRRPEDAEIAALVAASLAFGRASALIEKARAALAGFGPDLAGTVSRLREGDVPPHLAHLVHRWVSGRDIAILLCGAGRLLRERGALGAAFRARLRDDDDPAHLLDPLRRFALSLAPEDPWAWYPDGPLPQGARYLLSVPDGHAAAKRWCLLLRWMVRPADGVDLGLWSDLGTHRLTIPLDTHVARIGAYIGLTDRRTPGWAMAREITLNLARFDATDPTRYDFALSHLGIMGSCPRRRNLAKCASCDLVTACRL